MSAWMVSNDTLSKIANLIETYKNVGFNGFGFDFPDKLITIFNNKTVKETFEILADMNKEALKARYPHSYAEMIGETIFDSKADIYRTRYAGLTYHWQFLKSLQCYLYQCCEGNVPDCDLYKELTNLKHTLQSYIISQMPEYNKAEWK